MLNLSESSNEEAPGQFVSMLAELNVESKLSVQGLSRNFAAIYGANYGQEGASLLVYNTQFKVVNAKQYFKVYLDFSRLWARDEHILLAMGQNIAAVRYRMNDELLVDMLGSQLSDANLTPIELDHINEEESLEAAIKFVGNSRFSVVSRTVQPVPPPKKLPPADGATVPFESPEVLEQELNELLKQHVEGEVIPVKSALEDISVTLMSNFYDAGPQNLAVQSIVRQLERSGAGEQEITEKLLTLFIKTDNSEHVLMCVRRYSNISEYMLAWCLRYALDKRQPALTNGTANGGDAMETDDEPAQSAPVSDELLNAVLACTFNSSAIECHLRQRLELPHVRQLLQHLYVLASAPDVFLEDRPNQDTLTLGKNIVTEMQAFKWLGALLTSHITLITLSKDEQLLPLLSQWSKLFETYRELIAPLSLVVPILTNIITRRKVKTVYHAKWYDIQKFRLF